MEHNSTPKPKYHKPIAHTENKKKSAQTRENNNTTTYHILAVEFIKDNYYLSTANLHNSDMKTVRNSQGLLIEQHC